ncbi:hypothetical protein KJ806_00940, partial [Patescibacteria group bacterium]|nr:hypothetical protein [Patescibacteria group bacterium]
FIILEGKEHWSSLVTINELDSFSNFTKKQKVTFLISLFPFLQEFYPSLPVAIINSAEPGRIENR